MPARRQRQRPRTVTPPPGVMAAACSRGTRLHRHRGRHTHQHQRAPAPPRPSDAQPPHSAGTPIPSPRHAQAPAHNRTTYELTPLPKTMPPPNARTCSHGPAWVGQFTGGGDPSVHHRQPVRTREEKQSQTRRATVSSRGDRAQAWKPPGWAPAAAAAPPAVRLLRTGHAARARPPRKSRDFTSLTQPAFKPLVSAVDAQGERRQRPSTVARPPHRHPFAKRTAHQGQLTKAVGHQRHQNAHRTPKQGGRHGGGRERREEAGGGEGGEPTQVTGPGRWRSWCREIGLRPVARRIAGCPILANS